MQDILQQLIPEATQPSKRKKVLLEFANSCNSYEDVIIFNALCRRLPTETSEPLQTIIRKNITTITNDSIKIIRSLIQGHTHARILVYQILASELSTDDEDKVEKLLEFTYLVSIQDKESIPDFFIDKLWSFIICKEDSTLTLVSRILNIKGYNGNSERWFQIIKERIILTSHGDVPAYKCWLSWLRYGPHSVHLKEALKTNDYWCLIRRGITTIPRSTERIKHCLNILDFSLENLEWPLDLDVMKWDPSSKLCRSLWTRFVALTEIISVDLSHNQAGESRGDIIALCQNSQFVPATWVLALLQSGLTTSAENIRNFILDIIFELPNQDLFNADPRFLVSYVLPLASDAGKFSIENQDQCEYIERLSQFVTGIISALEPHNRALFLEKLLKAYQTQVYAYDLPRVVILNALLKFSIPISVETLTELANYAKSARRVSKSHVVGQMIYDTCIMGMKYIGDKEKVFLLEKLFSSGSFDRIELALAHIEDKEDVRRQIAELALTKAVYFVAYAKLAEKYLWPELEIRCHPQPVLIVNALGPCLEQAVCEYASAEFTDSGYFKEDTMKALLVNGKTPKIEAPLSPTCAADLVGQAQLQRLSCELATGTSQHIEVSSLFEKLQRTASGGYLSGHERILNAQQIMNTVEMINPTRSLRDQEINILERCFGYDYPKSQISVLRCINRYLSSEQSIDLASLSEVLMSMWDILIENGLKAISRSIHLEFISVFLHPRLFWSPDAAKRIDAIASNVVASSHARKNLLCPLVRAINQKVTPETTHLPIWACKVLVEAYTLQRTRHDVFYLEDIAKARYLPYSNPINKQFWPESEKGARLLAIQTLETQKDQGEAIAEIICEDEKYHLFSAVNSHDGVEENIRILCFQVLVLVHTHWTPGFYKKLLPLLVTAVDQEGSKVARIYVEWLLTSFVLENKCLLNKLILDPLRNSQEPRFVSSLGRAGLLVAKAMGSKTRPSYLTEFLNVMLPLSTSNKAAIRHFSVAMIYAIYLDIQLEPLLEGPLREIVTGISKCAESSDQFRNFKQGDDCVWNVIDEQTLEGICGGVICKLYRYDPLYCLKVSELELQEGPSTSNYNLAKLAHMTTIRDNILTENIQTKASTEQETKRTELIVVASLCDIAVNLGGICRLSDALGVKMLALNDLRVVKNSHFRNTCVTSDRWQPMCQVKENNIAEYMLEKKREGYTLIGLEQTDNSKMLNPSLKFPTKSLLLIGRERQGIPSNLLVYLDFCVEIEQWGVVRSMNVQTATAVIVHAYNNQH